jgi:hypothetical protein
MTLNYLITNLNLVFLTIKINDGQKCVTIIWQIHYWRRK